jgi:hypothetical protein
MGAETLPMLCNTAETNRSKSDITSNECHILHWAIELPPNTAKSSRRQENIGSDVSSEMQRSKLNLYVCLKAHIL